MQAVSRGQYLKYSKLSIKEALAFLLENLPNRPGETPKQKRDKADKSLTYARLAKKNPLTFEPDGKVLFGYLTAWADRQWPGVFSDYPKFVFMDCPLEQSWIIEQPLPSNMEECQEEIVKLRRENEILRNKLAKLEPLADRYLENARGNRENARLPRK